MKKYINILKSNVLFNGIAPNDLENMLGCLSGRVTSYKKNDTILISGNEVNFIGIVLSGKIKVIKEDADGNTSILANMGASDIFAEALACAGVKESPITVQATEDCEIMFINFYRIITSCGSACMFHTKLIENMLRLIARKNLMLNQKIDILSKRTIREKLFMFFELQSDLVKQDEPANRFTCHESKKFTVPFNREGLADYLCVDRSAMSRELCKMRDEGLISFKKNEFEII